MHVYSSILTYIFGRGSVFLSSHIYKYFLPFWSMCWPQLGWLDLEDHLQPTVSGAITLRLGAEVKV